jgi:hypothetical protein
LPAAETPSDRFELERLAVAIGEVLTMGEVFRYEEKSNDLILILREAATLMYDKVMASGSDRYCEFTCRGI